MGSRLEVLERQLKRANDALLLALAMKRLNQGPLSIADGLEMRAIYKILFPSRETPGANNKGERGSSALSRAFTPLTPEAEERTGNEMQTYLVSATAVRNLNK